MKAVFFGFLLFMLYPAHSQTVEEWVRRGLERDSLGDQTMAITCFGRAIQMEPNLVTPYFNRSVCYLKLKNYPLALVDLNKTIYLDTNFIEAYYNRYIAYRYTNSYEFALGDISHFLRYHPADVDALLERADLAMEMKSYEQAAQDLKTLIENGHQQGSNLELKLAEALALGGKYDEACRVVAGLQAKEPGNHELNFLQGWYAHKASDFAASQEALNLYLLNANSREALKLKADNYFFMNRFDEAAALYLQLLENDSTEAGLLADYGHCLLQLNKFVLAEEILGRSIRNKADNPSYAYLGRGIARLNLGHGDEACSDWEKSLMLGEQKAIVYLNRHCIKSGTQ